MEYLKVFYVVKVESHCQYSVIKWKENEQQSCYWCKKNIESQLLHHI